jgi:fibronectin type 3 domain-containing protein
MLTPRAWIPVVALLLSVLAAGCSKSSSPEAGGGAPTPLKAYSLTASAADSAATLSWPSINGASTYTLYWSTGADVNPASANKLTNVATPYTHTGLSNGTTYRYLFTALTAAGESTPSNAVKVTPKLPRDGAPTKVSAFAGDGRITLTWAAVPNATRYSVYWNTSGDVSTNDTKVENITYPAVHTGLTNGQQYYYIVTADTPTYGVVASAEVSTAPHIAAPSPPLSISVSAGDQQANLSWPAVSDATAYAIYWKKERDRSDQVSLADTRIEVTTPNYTHSGLTNNTRYHYRIAALNTQGPSVLSAEVTAKPRAPAPGAPSNVTATASNEHITLNWNPVAGASQYNLYWDAGAGAAVTVIANVKPPFVHQPLSGGVPVNYTVSALREGVESASSAQISATPLGALPPAPVPLNPQAAKQQVTLAWTAVDQALSYRLYWHTQANPTETLIAVNATPAPSYTHTGLLDSTTYYYRIEAIAPDGISPSSTEFEATTLAAVAPTTTGPPPTQIPTTYTIGGNIVGLALEESVGLSLSTAVGAGQTTTSTASSYAFNTGLPSGSAYTLTITASPSGKTCLFTTNNSSTITGSVNSADVSVAVACTTNPTYSVGGTVSGLTGDGVVVANRLSATLLNLATLNKDGSFTFIAALPSGASYNVFVVTQPANPTQTCVPDPANSSGTITNANVAVKITCTTTSFTVSGSVTGLVGTGLVIANNGAPLALSATNTFSVSLPSGMAYTLVISANPAGQTCVFANGTGSLGGTVTNANIGNIAVTCANNYTVTAVVANAVAGTIGPASASVAPGATVSFSVTANTGYYVDAVTGCGGALVGNTDTYTTGAITADCTVTASFGVPVKLNDTGITEQQCYQVGSDVLVACGSAGAIALNPAQDGMSGRDANPVTNGAADGKLGFSFTKVCNSGALAGTGACPADPALGSMATDWGCTYDNVTGLMWEVKTDDPVPGLRDWTLTYTNYDSTTAAQKYDPVTNTYPTQAEIDAASNSIGFKNRVNSQTLCGHNDWRLSTADELHSLVDDGVAAGGPTIDAAWFPNMQSGYFWSASPYVGNSTYAWVVNFSDGFVLNYDRYSTYYVRLVRAGQ